MVVVGENLKALMIQHAIVAGHENYDVFSLTLTLDDQFLEIKPPKGVVELEYGKDIPNEWIRTRTINHDGLLLRPNEGILACSREVVKIPIGYLGFLQTKGSLARYFVSIANCDSQIEPGYSGKITFEMFSAGGLHVRLFAGQPVAQLFIFQTSTKECPGYKGRYQGATGPTWPRFQRSN